MIPGSSRTTTATSKRVLVVRTFLQLLGCEGEDRDRRCTVPRHRQGTSGAGDGTFVRRPDERRSAAAAMHPPECCAFGWRTRAVTAVRFAHYRPAAQKEGALR